MTDSQTAIKVQNLSKRYRIGLKEETHDTLAATLANYVRSPLHNLRRLRRLTSFADRPQPTTNGNNPSSTVHRPSSDPDIIWALKDVSFEVKQGEVVGVIGRNGAGKSTLLKILSRITHPTSGRVELNGRVSSLLEVGTGFHPELTGRENIYLNGTILGMRKAEIDRKFDEIVDFSGVEKFIDTPVKRYSSGMRVRLAFSVAAHLEPEILLVDEVLAVGDVEFQKKCMGKMEHISGEGRTVLFVSHNMASINKLCARSLWLHSGEVRMSDETSRVIEAYLTQGYTSTGRRKIGHAGSSTAIIHEIGILGPSSEFSPVVAVNKDFRVMLLLEITQRLERAQIALAFLSSEGNTVFVTTHADGLEPTDAILEPGLYRAEVMIPGRFMNVGRYSINVRVWGRLQNGGVRQSYADAFHAISFEVEETGSISQQMNDRRRGYVTPLFSWDLQPAAASSKLGIETS